MESIIGVFVMAFLIVCLLVSLIKQEIRNEQAKEPKVAESEDYVMW